MKEREREEEMERDRERVSGLVRRGRLVLEYAWH